MRPEDYLLSNEHDLFAALREDFERFEALTPGTIGARDIEHKAICLQLEAQIALISELRAIREQVAGINHVLARGKIFVENAGAY